VADQNSFNGQIGVTDDSSEYNNHIFIIEQETGKIRTSTPVKIIAVHGGGVGAPPTVDVQPMVNQTDGAGNSTPHGTIYGIPCSRNQGGLNAIINDPVVGDVGHMVISDRDISSLKANNGAQSNPGSFRKGNMADGVYHAGMLQKTAPNQYIQFRSDGITLADNKGNTIVTGSAGVNINGLIIDKNGNLTTPGSIQAGTGGADSVTLQHHTHGGGPVPDPGT
jgi:hypothetical protein